MAAITTTTLEVNLTPPRPPPQPQSEGLTLSPSPLGSTDGRSQRGTELRRCFLELSSNHLSSHPSPGSQIDELNFFLSSGEMKRPTQLPDPSLHPPPFAHVTHTTSPPIVLKKSSLHLSEYLSLHVYLPFLLPPSLIAFRGLFLGERETKIHVLSFCVLQLSEAFIQRRLRVDSDTFH